MTFKSLRGFSNVVSRNTLKCQIRPIPYQTLALIQTPTIFKWTGRNFCLRHLYLLAKAFKLRDEIIAPSNLMISTQSDHIIRKHFSLLSTQLMVQWHNQGRRLPSTDHQPGHWPKINVPRIQKHTKNRQKVALKQNVTWSPEISKTTRVKSCEGLP